ncbi:MAG TPA: response regulator transcription factor [Kofleriaceae bacterium]|nr:response regulator transcription factor [Kofleriaceae bacterium]
MVGDVQEPAKAEVMLVDDHPAYRTGLHALLAHAPGIGSVVEAGTVAAALDLSSRHRFALAVVDVVLPEGGGPSLVRQLVAQQPTCRILALSMIDEPIRIAEMLRLGAHGYAFKSQPVEEILAAVHCVLHGERYLPPQIAPVPAIFEGAPLPLDSLTARERAVFALLVRGLTSRGAADELSIARRTLDAHRRHIMHKLGARSVVDLIRLAMRSGTLGSPT